jgi:predicted nucleic acid-binding protein
MSRFVDSSFLFALYAPNERLDDATQLFDDAEEQLIVSSLVVFEFRQAIWFHVFRRSRGDAVGFPQQTAENALAAFEADLDTGRFALVDADFHSLIQEARRIIESYTARHGVRSMDILHLAAARQFGCDEFLTCDQLQRHIADLEGFGLPL